MTTVVIMPGGFHPFHAGHLALYQSAQRAFPDAEVFVAATNDTSARPFPFAVKEKLAKLAGVEPGHFVQVKSPFRAEEITSKFDPNKDTVIFVRSEKDVGKPPQGGGMKKDGTPAYLQPLLGAKRLEPFSKHAYMAYLPTVEFGPGMTSATEIRAAWPQLNDQRKTALVMSLYPKTQGNPKLAQTVVKLLDTAMGSGLDEDLSRRGFLKGAGAAAVAGAAGGAMAAPFKHTTDKDQMTGEKTADVSTVKSNDGKAILELRRGAKPMVVLEVPGAIFNARTYGTSCRYKIGNGPVIETLLGKPSSGASNWGAILPQFNGGKGLAEKIMQHSGEVLFEVDLYRIGPKVFKFTIEPNSTSKSVNEQGVAEAANTSGAGAGMMASYQARENQPVAERHIQDYMEEARS